jgi:hypothetical protein
VVLLLTARGAGHNKFIPEIQRITFFISKEPALRLVRQALIALAVVYINEKLQIL